MLAAILSFAVERRTKTRQPGSGRQAQQGSQDRALPQHPGAGAVGRSSGRGGKSSWQSRDDCCHPAAAPDRMPQERNPGAAVGLGRHAAVASPAQFQDGGKGCAAGRTGSGNSRVPATPRGLPMGSAGGPGQRPFGRSATYFGARSLAAGLDDVRLHDLRHAFASVAVAAGSSYLLGKVLGHTQARTTERYAHLDADPVHVVADRTARKMAQALEGLSAASEVVPLHQGRDLTRTE